MTNCCRRAPCEQMFTARVARKDLARFRKKGLDDLEQRMTGSAESAGLEGARVLEIGGGIGRLLVVLLERGASTGEVVELVPAYERFARELAHEHGLEGRMTFVVADVLESPESVAPREIVVLNRVVCCSEDGVELASVAARLTRRVLVLSYPRDVSWVRLGIGAVNLVQRLLRRSFRAYVHRPAELRAAAEAAGLRRSETGRGFVWEYATFVSDVP